MLNLGGGADGSGATTPANDWVKDVTEQSFMQDVVEASKEAAVIVDFWAPWCGPCKTLTPQLEAAVQASKGRLRLAKVNVDEEQRLTQALGQQLGQPIQSIPTVIAIVNGAPVDGFMGAVGPAELKQFIERLLQQTPAGDGGLEEALLAAEEMLAQGAAADAAQVFGAILGEEPENAAAIGGMARAQLAAGALEEAKATLAAAPADKTDAPEIAAARAQIELAEASAGLGEADELAARVQADPDDHQARLDLALAHAAAGRTEEAVDELVELFRRDREWNEGAAKAQLLKLIDSLGPKDPLAGKARRRLASMILV